MRPKACAIAWSRPHRATSRALRTALYKSARPDGPAAPRSALATRIWRQLPLAPRGFQRAPGPAAGRG
eukprot:6604926-Alexandrium_andersonii.AAC.1